MTIDPEKKPKKPLSPTQKAIWEYRFEILSGLLMLTGLILAFFYLHTGGALAGLGFGICFFAEIEEYISKLRANFVERGTFKTLMLLGAILYLLLAAAGFVIAIFIGFGIRYLTRKLMNKQ